MAPGETMIRLYFRTGGGGTSDDEESARAASRGEAEEAVDEADERLLLLYGGELCLCCCEVVVAVVGGGAGVRGDAAEELDTDEDKDNSLGKGGFLTTSLFGIGPPLTVLPKEGRSAARLFIISSDAMRSS